MAATKMVCRTSAKYWSDVKRMGERNYHTDYMRRFWKMLWFQSRTPAHASIVRNVVSNNRKQVRMYHSSFLRTPKRMTSKGLG